MVRSMTGYGKSEAVAGNKKIIAEVRSLNSKQLDLSVKMPPLYRSAEYDIRSNAGKVVQRGKVDIYINTETSAGVPTANINTELFGSYYHTLSEMSRRMNGGGVNMDAAMMISILRLPEVVTGDSTEVSEEELSALYAAVNGALNALEDFRKQEGKTLMEDILKRIDRIEKFKQEVVPFEKRRVDAMRERIRENIASMNIPVDENRLEQEMIFYVEKLDITEEKVRLSNHCKYFREVAMEEENPGRKLGFIAQEIGREINTMGSKANDSDIQKLVVQMKDELEKIKEQVLNIL